MNEPDLVRVVLVDDHTVFRESLQAVLVPRVDAIVVGSYGSAEEALAAIGHLAPDVVLMDLSLPGTGGLEAIRQIVRRFPGVRLLVLSMSDDVPTVRAALEAGATGYLAKSSSLSEMIRGIHAARDGQLLLGSTVSKHLQTAPHRDAEATILASLSRREQDVLRLLAAGTTTGQMAAQLNISQKTVRNVLGTLYAKLGVEDRGQAALVAESLVNRSGRPGL